MKTSVSYLVTCFAILSASVGSEAYGEPNATDENGEASVEHRVVVFYDEAGNPRWRCRLRLFKIEPCNPHDEPLLPSPDFRRFAQAACDEEGRSNQMILDGKKQKKYDQILERKFSPDSRMLVHGAREDDKSFVVINGKEGPRYDDVWDIVISPNSKRIAYVVDTADYDEAVVLEGKELGPYDDVDVWSPVFSSDSRHLAYCAYAGNEHSVYLEGEKIDSFDELANFSLQFAPDSTTLTYTYRRGKQWFLAFGAKKYGPYDEIDESDADLSADSKRVAFPARLGRKWFLVSDDKKFGPYAWSSSPLFSPDSKHLAHFASAKSRTAKDSVTAFLDGKSLGDFDGVGHDAFSPDSKHIAFIASKGEESFLVIDGEPVAENVTDFAYSPDGNRLVTVLATDGKVRVCEAGRQGKAYERIEELHFSPDSKHLAYWGIEGWATPRREFILVVDDVETVRFNDWPWEELLFTKEGGIRGAGVLLLNPKKHRAPGWQIDDKEAIKDLRFVLFELTELK